MNTLFHGARLWGGEGDLTRTGSRPHLSIRFATPAFRSDEDWLLAVSMDAPEHIARGGVIANESSLGGVVMFASEPRP